MLDDEAANQLPDATQLTTGSWRPANWPLTSDAFPGPAPTQSANVDLSTFDGMSPNGTWALWLYDDAGGDLGNITSWSLSITTSGARHHHHRHPRHLRLRLRLAVTLTSSSPMRTPKGLRRRWFRRSWRPARTRSTHSTPQPQAHPGPAPAVRGRRSVQQLGVCRRDHDRQQPGRLRGRRRCRRPDRVQLLRARPAVRDQRSVGDGELQPVLSSAPGTARA